jgi:hypothetical protein
MSDEILDSDELTETEMTQEEAIVNLLSDISADNPPSDWASDFIDEFFLRSRPETDQILMMLEAPTENLLEMLKAFISGGCQNSLNILDEKGYAYLEGLKKAVRTQLEELANNN